MELRGEPTADTFRRETGRTDPDTVEKDRIQMGAEPPGMAAATDTGGRIRRTARIAYRLLTYRHHEIHHRFTLFRRDMPHVDVG